MKQFSIPFSYRSLLISAIKEKRKEADKMKKDFTPTLLDLGNVQIYLARHFGFCYGVENAIEIAFKTIDENPGKRIFLLSEMIHNPQVNADLQARGVTFLQDTKGNMLIPFEELTAEDVVIIPAFGTTLLIEEKLNSIGISTKKYNTTCPFVEKVWNRGEQIAKKNYAVVVHGKHTHEETRATFSHAANVTPTVIDIEKDLERIGVINQTTMLASDTQGIADFLKSVMIEKYKLTEANIAERFADTRDTLCYATNDNQSAIYGLLEQEADFAIVVGGYNSSNTSHLVELCEQKLTTYFINAADKITVDNKIFHFDLHTHTEVETNNFIPDKTPVKILISSGASCPDALVEAVIQKIATMKNDTAILTELTEKIIAGL
jgi:4-hydroxy-3-methylbut-2-en-1-yl diphosphate reductase